MEGLVGACKTKRDPPPSKTARFGRRAAALWMTSGATQKKQGPPVARTIFLRARDERLPCADREISVPMREEKESEILRSSLDDGPRSEVEEAGFGDGGDGADGVENGGRDLAVDADEGDGMGTLVGGAAAEREGGDVDAELAERRADLANYAGFVFVAEVEDGAFQLRFERDALNIEDAR